MSDVLDFPKVESVCWRALCQHQVNERAMVVAATVIRLSFVVGEPYLRLNHAIEIARLTGLSKGNAHAMVQVLVRGRALEVSDDGTIYTFLPPSKAWPWLFAPRVDALAANELERAIVWGNTQRQGELFAPDPDREFAEALAIERMREALMEQHRWASTRLISADRVQPKPAERDRGEPARPLETPPASSIGGSAGGGTLTLEAPPPASTERPESYYFHPPEPPPEADEGSSRIGNRTVPELGTSHLDALSDSVSCKEVPNTESLNALSERFPNREPSATATAGWRVRLDPQANEEEILAWLRGVLGWKAMEKYGGWWRNMIRGCRRAVLEAIYNYQLSVESHGPKRSPGGWLRDQCLRFVKLFKRETPE